MQKRMIGIFVLALVAVIVAIVVIDYNSTRPDRRGGNPYAFTVGAYAAVDPVTE